MAWEALSDEEKDALREYLACFSRILDEVSDYCEANRVQIVSAGTMLDLGAAYTKVAESVGLGNPFERFLTDDPKEDS